jgi:hypothetical protein
MFKVTLTTGIISKKEELFSFTKKLFRLISYIEMKKCTFDEVVYKSLTS